MNAIVAPASEIENRALAPERVDVALAALRRAAAEFPPVALVTGFGSEGMVLIDLAARAALDFEIVTLDTGRLPEETHRLMQRVKQRYHLAIKVYSPDAVELQSFVATHGPNAFYDGTELRRRCCHLRKVEPLRRALRGKRAWVTGLRQAQSSSRRDAAVEEYDAEHGLVKFNPLAEWSDADVWQYIQSHDVPYNALHDMGYTSIGCAPCTRAITEGEDARAGRWWWERSEHKECGIHRHARTHRISAPAQV